jgi:hypothetical protein
MESEISGAVSVFVGALTENSMISHTGVPKKFAEQGISIPSFDYLQVYYKDISLFLRHPDTQKGWGKQKLF